MASRISLGNEDNGPTLLGCEDLAGRRRICLDESDESDVAKLGEQLTSLEISTISKMETADMTR
jgi:hypothetical protein